MPANRVVDDHVELENIGNNTHAQIDTHISNEDNYMENVVEDITPQLGGNLDLQTHAIVGEGGTEGIYIDNDGDVGIGTTNPTSKLSIQGTINELLRIRALSGDGRIMLRGENAGAGNPIFGIIWENNDAGVYNAAMINSYNAGGVQDGDLRFSTANAGTLTEKVRIQENGDVGIGTTSPTEMLDIDSDAIRVRTAKTITNSTDPGNTGDICWDADYIYTCVSTNQWKRAALSTW